MGNACGTGQTRTGMMKINETDKEKRRKQQVNRQVKVIKFTNTTQSFQPSSQVPSIIVVDTTTGDEANNSLSRTGRFPFIKDADYLQRVSDETLMVKEAIKKLVESHAGRGVFLEIVGKQGVGKSIFLAHLLTSELNVESILWFNAGDLNEQTKHVLQDDYSLFKHFQKQINDRRIETRINGSCLVVLDLNDREMPVKRLKHFELPRSVRLVVISRKASALETVNSVQLKNDEQPQCILLKRSLKNNETMTFNQLVKVAFQDMFPQLLSKAMVFLLFQPGQAVKSGDLALLWNLAKPQDAQDMCEAEFCSRGIVQAMIYLDPAEKKAKSSKYKKDYFLNAFSHEAMSTNFKESYQMKNFLMKEAGRKFPSAKKGENILHLAVRLKRGHLLSAIVSHLEVQQLIELCLEKTEADGGGRSVVDYLCETDCLFNDENASAQQEKDSNFFPGFAQLLDKLSAQKNDIVDRVIKANPPNHRILFEAAASNLCNLAELVLRDKSIDINAVETLKKSMKTCLMIASFYGHEEFVSLFIEHGADVNNHNYENGTAIYQAASCGRSKVVKLLLEKGANPTMTAIQADPVDYQKCGEDDTALTAAAKHGYGTTVQLLLGDKRIKDAKEVQKSSLLLAVQNGHCDTVDALLNAGWDPDTAAILDGNTALMIAAEEGHKDVVELLLNKGAKIYTQNKEGETALNIAIAKGFPDIAHLIMARKSDEKKRDNLLAESNLFAAIRKSDEEAVKTLLQSKTITADSFENEIVTPLYLAVEKGNLSLVELLLKNGANPNLVSGHKSKQSTALNKAVDLNDAEMVEALLKKGAFPNLASTEIGTALVHAVLVDNLKIVQELLKRGADPNVKHVHDLDPVLAIAVRRGNASIAEELLAKGAIFNEVTADGKTPQEIAQKRGFSNIVEMLVQFEDKKLKDDQKEEQRRAMRAMKANGFL